MIFGKDALVGIGDDSQSDTGVGIGVFAMCVYHMVLVTDFCAIRDIIAAALRRKSERRILDPGDIIRMYIPVHIVIHERISFCPVRQAKKFKQTLRKRHSHYAPIKELIDTKCQAAVFDQSEVRFTVAISGHKSPKKIFLHLTDGWHSP